MSTETHDTLAAALVAFQGEMPKVHKGKTAQVPTKSGGSYSYSYADLADVSAAATPLLVKHGLSFTAQPRRTEQGDYELVGVLRHTSGQSDEGALPLHGRTPQELGSAITYARRYLLGCLTGIVTDDDTDAAPAQDAPRTRRAPSAQEQAAAALNAAKRSAWAAWQQTGGTDAEAMRADYEQRYALPLADATADDLHGYARDLLAAALAPTEEGTETP